MNTCKSFKELRKIQTVFDGQKRCFWCYIPADSPVNKPLPILVFLHGGGSNARNGARAARLFLKARQENFILVLPEGSGKPGLFRTWNAGTCCGYAMRKRIDDVGFITTIIEELASKIQTDSSRIYLAGFSNGGMLAQRIGNERPEPFAAIACVSGAFVATPYLEKEPISILLIHGDADRAVPYEGGKRVLFRGWLRTHPDTSVEHAIQFWIRRNQCNETPIIEEREKVHIERYPNGKQGTEVVLCRVRGGNHAWPGGYREWPFAPKPVSFFSATDFLWDFFKRHVKQ